MGVDMAKFTVTLTGISDRVHTDAGVEAIRIEIERYCSERWPDRGGGGQTVELERTGSKLHD